MHRTQNLTVSAADTDDTDVVVTPADILRGAARYLSLYGWTTCFYYDGDPDIAFPPACADGAIGMAAYGHVTMIPGDETDDLGYRDYRLAHAYFHGYLTDTGAYANPDDTEFFGWNDADEQTADKVIAVLHEAADDYDRTHSHPDTNDQQLDMPLLDTGGYLACGCHGSQRDHTCDPLG